MRLGRFGGWGVRGYELVGAAVLVLAVILASAAAAPAPGGTAVQVVYPAALAGTMQKWVAPAFEKATGLGFVGRHFPASEVASHVLRESGTADVVIFASAQDDLQLIGHPNGMGIQWYLMFMQSPLVLGYEARGRFAHQLAVEPWHKVAVQPGFRLGVTDPDTDAKGQLIAAALHRIVGGRSHDPSSKALARNSQLVPAPDLVKQLKSGHLDASFFYLTQALAAGLSNVPLHEGPISTTYTIAILNHAPNPKAASAFVAFLLSSQGYAAFAKNKGVVMMSEPTIFGNVFAAPTAVRSALHKRLGQAG